MLTLSQTAQSKYPAPMNNPPAEITNLGPNLSLMYPPASIRKGVTPVATPNTGDISAAVKFVEVAKLIF